MRCKKLILNTPGSVVMRHSGMHGAAEPPSRDGFPLSPTQSNRCSLERLPSLQFRALLCSFSEYHDDLFVLFKFAKVCGIGAGNVNHLIDHI